MDKQPTSRAEETNEREPANATRDRDARRNRYGLLGAMVCGGLAAAVAVGFMDVEAPGIISYGTAMVMIGTAMTVLSIGLVAALFTARKALVAVEAYSEAMARQTAKHAEDLAAAQAQAIAVVKAAEARDRQQIQALHHQEQQLEVRFDKKGKEIEDEFLAVRAEEANLSEKVAGEIGHLETRVASTRHELKETETSTKDLRSTVDKVLAEERERKAEFEALAAEEIRLMGRLGRTEALARGKAGREGEHYRISRPRATHRGPFGELYSVRDVEGLSASRADRLKEFGIVNTEDLWRANPRFVATLLRCQTKDVERWQEEAELMAINGIGRERAKILVEAGVTSIAKLSTQEPERIVRKAGRADKDAAQAGMTEANVAKWVEAAKKLQPGR